MLKHTQVKSIEKEVSKRLHKMWSKDMYFVINEAHFNYIEDLKDFVTLVCQAGKYDKAKENVIEKVDFKMDLMTLEIKDKNEAAAVIYTYLIKKIDGIDIFKKIK